MEIVDTEIPEVKVITPRRIADGRGFFSEIYNKHTLRDLGIEYDFVQDNSSWSREAGVVRGLHFQAPPFAQDKLIRVARGAVFDVAVDIRRDSPTFGRHVSLILSEETWNQMLIPAGFAHGFCSLEPDTMVVYKVSDYYAPDHEQGIRWDDSELNIPWPVGAEQALVSDRDMALPTLTEIVSPFVYSTSAASGS